MKKNLFIIGKGKQSDLIQGDKFFVKKYKNIFCENVNNLKILEKILIKLNIKEFNKTEFIISIGNNYLREKLSKIFIKKIPNINWATYISKSSVIKEKVIISSGSMIMENVFINKNTIVKKHVLINSGSTIEHDNLFEEFSSCGPGTITGGEVYIGKKTFLGLGSKIKNKITIKQNTIIGMGSVIINNCKNDSIYFGNPAKYIKKNTRKSHF